MAFKVVVTDDAYIDLVEAINYYESKSLGLGEKFFNIYQKKIKEVSKNPFYFSYYTEDFRRISFDNFSYIMIYKVHNQEEVIVYQITFAGRNPKTITGKLKGK